MRSEVELEVRFPGRSRGAQQTSARLREIYGVDPARDEGVLHVVAVGRAANGPLPVIAIGASSPKSELDSFVLRAARMRADAIVTTGKILRDEPELAHEERDEALLAWRRECVGKSEPPRSVVLTSGRGFDPRHPLLAATPPPQIATGRASAARVRAAAPRCEVIELESPSLRALLRALSERGARTILVEAGPASARELYDPPVAVDELLLSSFEERDLARELAAGELPARDLLERVLAPCAAPFEQREPSGAWRFERLRRVD